MPRGASRRNRVWRTLPPTAPAAHLEVDSGIFGTFTADEGGAPFVPSGTFQVKSEAGYLETLTTSIRYTSAATGWLSASVTKGSERIWLGSVTITPTALSEGVHTAVVVLLSPDADNTGQEVAVTLTVVTPVTTMSVSPSSRTFTATEGQTGTSATVTITNSGGIGVLPTPTVGSISYGAGASNWVSSVTITGPTGGPWTATINTSALGVPDGVFSCTIPFSAARASNAPQSVTCDFTVTAAAPATPTLQLSTSGVNLIGVAGTAQAPSTTVTASSGNATPLGTTTVGTITGTAAAAISTNVVGHVVTITATVGALPAAVYSATVPILDSAASNSPQNVTVTFTVAAAPTAFTTVTSALVPYASTIGVQSRGFGGWTFPPGTFSVADHTAKKFSLWIDGVEQSIVTNLWPGRHPDGSVRAIEYQFLHTPPSSAAVTCEVRIGTARGTTDLTRVVPTKTDLFVELPAQAWGVDAEPTMKLVPTDIDYLCATDAAFMPLQPASMDDAVSAGRFTTMLTTQAAKLETLTLNRANTLVPERYQSTYEAPRALIAAWCRTGDATLLRYALRLAWRLVALGHPVPSYTKFNPHPNVYSETRMLGTNDTNAGYQEQYTMRYMSYAACWQLSAYVPFYTEVNRWHQQYNSASRETLAGATALVGSTGWMTQGYLIRTNTIPIYPALAAYMIGANRRTTSQSGYGNRDMNFSVAFPLYLTALENVTYAKGDYRDGFVAQNPAATDNNTVPAGQFPNFQVEIINAGILMLFEREVYADPRIPGWIKTNTSIVLQNAKPLTAGSRGYNYTTDGYGLTYSATSTAGQGTAHSDYLGLIVASIAYCAAKWPNDVVNGATFTQWYQRAADFRNNADVGVVQEYDWDRYDRAHKVFGEMFGFSQCAPYFIAQGVPAGATAIQTMTPPSAWP